jgi:hypothetical protein
MTILINNQKFLIDDEPRPNLLTILLDEDKRIITHIPKDKVYEKDGNYYYDGTINIRREDGFDGFAMSGLGRMLWT